MRNLVFQSMDGLPAHINLLLYLVVFVIPMLQTSFMVIGFVAGVGLIIYCSIGYLFLIGFLQFDRHSKSKYTSIRISPMINKSHIVNISRKNSIISAINNSRKNSIISINHKAFSNQIWLGSSHCVTPKMRWSTIVQRADQIKSCWTQEMKFMRRKEAAVATFGTPHAKRRPQEPCPCYFQCLPVVLVTEIDRHAHMQRHLITICSSPPPQATLLSFLHLYFKVYLFDWQTVILKPKCYLFLNTAVVILIS